MSIRSLERAPELTEEKIKELAVLVNASVDATTRAAQAALRGLFMRATTDPLIQGDVTTMARQIRSLPEKVATINPADRKDIESRLDMLGTLVDALRPKAPEAKETPPERRETGPEARPTTKEPEAPAPAAPRAGILKHGLQTVQEHPVTATAVTAGGLGAMGLVALNWETIQPALAQAGEKIMNVPVLGNVLSAVGSGINTASTYAGLPSVVGEAAAPWVGGVVLVPAALWAIGKMKLAFMRGTGWWKEVPERGAVGHIIEGVKLFTVDPLNLAINGIGKGMGKIASGVKALVSAPFRWAGATAAWTGREIADTFKNRKLATFGGAFLGGSGILPYLATAAVGAAAPVGIPAAIAWALIGGVGGNIIRRNW